MESSLKSFVPNGGASAFVPAGPNSQQQQQQQARQSPLTCTGHTRPVVDLCFSGIVNGGVDYFMISACKDSVPIFRNGKTGQYIGSFNGHKGAVWSSKLSPDATLSATGSADFTCKVWDNVTGQPIATMEHSHIVRTVDISVDSRYVLAGGFEKKVRIFDLKNNSAAGGKETAIRCFEGFNNEIKSALLESNLGIAFVADGKELRVWDLRTSAQVSTRGFDDAISSLRFSHDRRFLICTSGKKVHFFDTVSAQLLRTFETTIQLSSASLHPDGSRFVVGGSSDLWVRVYDWVSGQEKEVYKGHHGPIHCVSYSPDGHLYASGSEDGTVRLWQTIPGAVYGLWQ